MSDLYWEPVDNYTKISPKLKDILINKYDIPSILDKGDIEYLRKSMLTIKESNPTSAICGELGNMISAIEYHGEIILEKE